jgi:hypothetical protein
LIQAAELGSIKKRGRSAEFGSGYSKKDFEVEALELPQGEATK